MTKVNFKYNLDKDAWSWIVIAKEKEIFGLNVKDQVPHIPGDLLSEIKKSSFSKSRKIVKDYIKSNSRAKYKKEIIKGELHTLEKVWKLVEEKYFGVLSEILQKPIYIDQFDCYFTSGVMCPYSEKENWFMVSMWHSIPSSITTICHEIMHLQFLYYYKKYLKKKGLKNEQIEDMKEALTFLLNEFDFKDIILVWDNGYPKHQKLRNKFKKIWKNEKNFSKFLDKAIEEIKEKK